MRLFLVSDTFRNRLNGSHNIGCTGYQEFHLNTGRNGEVIHLAAADDGRWGNEKIPKKNRCFFSVSIYPTCFGCEASSGELHEKHKPIQLKVNDDRVNMAAWCLLPWARKLCGYNDPVLFWSRGVPVY